MEKTYIPKASEIVQDWYVVDATNQNLGRLATQIASVLLGKNKPMFTPGMDTGDLVVVINAEQVEVTGRKMEEIHYYHQLEYNADTLSRTLQVQAKPRAADAGVKWFYLSKIQNQAKHPGFRNRTRA